MISFNNYKIQNLDISTRTPRSIYGLKRFFSLMKNYKKLNQNDNYTKINFTLNQSEGFLLLSDYIISLKRFYDDILQNINVNKKSKCYYFIKPSEKKFSFKEIQLYFLKVGFNYDEINVILKLHVNKNKIYYLDKIHEIRNHMLEKISNSIIVIYDDTQISNEIINKIFLKKNCVIAFFNNKKYQNHLNKNIFKEYLLIKNEDEINEITDLNEEDD